MTDLSEKEWNIASAIAHDLVLEKIDPNEVKKALEYLRTFRSENNLGKRFFQYLGTLSANGRQIGHSKKTIGYYKSLEKACKNHLQSYQDQPQLILIILGWATRLMRYYKTVPLGEEATKQPQSSKRQKEIEEASQKQNWQEGQTVEATVVGFNKGNKVTYELTATTQRLTNREPKKIKLLSEGQKVQVEIIAIKEGKINKIKCVDP